jgi:uncharacterized protein (TIGR00369 family)
VIQPRVADSFARQKMMAAIGAELVHADAGLCRIAAPILPAFTQQHGFGHAALTFSLGDTAAGYAALSVMPDSAEVLTAEMKINLLAPAKGERLVAEGRVLKPGRRLVVIAAEVRADDALIAVLQGTMIPV